MCWTLRRTGRRGNRFSRKRRVTLEIPVRLSAEGVMKRIWIMDGHNLIFAIRGLHEMQVSGRGDEARGALVDALRRFAQTRGEQVLVVFDGNELPRNPDVSREPFLETVYTRRSDGGADERIIHEAIRR